MNHNNVLLATSVTDQFWITTSILATKLLAIHCTSLQEAMCMSVMTVSLYILLSLFLMVFVLRLLQIRNSQTSSKY